MVQLGFSMASNVYKIDPNIRIYQKKIKKVLSPKEGSHIRNWLMFSVSVENYNRAGICSTMTTTDMDDAQRGNLGNMVLHITDHKTAGAYGGALVHLSPGLYHHMENYRLCIRSHIIANHEDAPENMFLSQGGNSLANVQVHHCLKSFAKKTGVISENKLEGFCSSMLRKAIVTVTREMPSPTKNNLAQLMAHSRKTADGHYNIVDRVNKTSEAHATISKIINEFDKVMDEHESEKAKSPMASPKEKTRTSVSHDPTIHSSYTRSTPQRESDDDIAIIPTPLSRRTYGRRSSTPERISDDDNASTTTSVIHRPTIHSTYRISPHKRRSTPERASDDDNASTTTSVSPKSTFHSTYRRSPYKRRSTPQSASDDDNASTTTSVSSKSTFHSTWRSPYKPKSTPQRASRDEFVIEDTNTISPSKYAYEGSRSVLAEFGERQRWSSEDEDVIKKVCGSLIYSSGSFKKSSLRFHVMTNRDLRIISEQQGFQRLYEKIKSLRKAK